MADAYWAAAEERDEIIEFIDYVFSKAHRPHDFASLLPKLYGKNGDGAAHHFVVREEGKLAATVLVYPVPMHIGEKTLMTLGVGSVSTHPRARGRGYMHLLMDAVDARAKEMGAAFAVLGGQRQRYQYFGFDHGGYQLHGEFTPDNARHALRGVDAAEYDVTPMTQAHVPQRPRCWSGSPASVRAGGRHTSTSCAPGTTSRLRCSGLAVRWASARCGAMKTAATSRSFCWRMRRISRRR